MSVAESEEVVEEQPEEHVPSALELPGAEQVPLDVRNIPLEEIAERDNYRNVYHGVTALAETMHVQGQLMPVVVREAPAEATHGKPFELIFGYRRKRAAEYLHEQGVEGWETIRCEVHPVPDEAALEQMIVENAQREDISAVAEARAMHSLKHSVDPPLKNVEIARRLGCDPSHVSHRLKLLDLALPAVGQTHAEEVEAERVDQGALSPAPATAAEEVESERDEDFDDVQAGVEIKPAAERSSEPAEAEQEPAGPEAAEPEAKPAKPPLDILDLVDQGKIEPSTAEVIATLETREQQEKLAKLVMAHGWSTKKAAAWARAVKENKADDGGDELGPVEMVKVEDVVELPRLLPRDDLDETDIARVALYALLRNGMDREMLDHLAEQMGYPYEQLWDYVRSLEPDQVAELTRRLALRYIGASHRYLSLEPRLRDELGRPEGEVDGVSDVYEGPLGLPAAGHSDEGGIW